MTVVPDDITDEVGKLRLHCAFDSVPACPATRTDPQPPLDPPLHSWTPPDARLIQKLQGKSTGQPVTVNCIPEMSPAPLPSDAMNMSTCRTPPPVFGETPSAGGALLVTVNCVVIVCDSDPLVAVTVTAPGEAVGAAPAPATKVTGVELKLTVTPGGNPLAANVMAPEGPLIAATESVCDSPSDRLALLSKTGQTGNAVC